MKSRKAFIMTESKNFKENGQLSPLCLNNVLLGKTLVSLSLKTYRCIMLKKAGQKKNDKKSNIQKKKIRIT